MFPEKRRLKEIADLTHDAVRMMHIGDSGMISLGKFTYDEVYSYLLGYSMHKDKWFNVTYDRTARVLRLVRIQPPPDDEPTGEFKEEVP